MGLLRDLINRRFQREQEEKQQDFTKRQTMANILLDSAKDPNRTGDEQEQIYAQVEQIIGGGKKRKQSGGGSPISMLLGKFLHDDHAGGENRQAEGPLRSVLGDLNRKVPVGEPQVRDSGFEPLGESQIKDLEGKEVGAAPLQRILEEFQPMRRRGDLTTQEIGDDRRLKLFRTEQGIKGEIDAENDERTRARAVEVANIRAKQALDAINARNNNLLSNLPTIEQYKASREMRGMESALIARGVEPAEAKRQAGELLTQKLTSIIGLRGAQTNLANVNASLAPEKVGIQQQNANTNAGRLDEQLYANDLRAFELGLKGSGLTPDAQGKVLASMQKVAELKKKGLDLLGESTFHRTQGSHDAANLKSDEARNYLEEAGTIAQGLQTAYPSQVKGGLDDNGLPYFNVIEGRPTASGVPSRPARSVPSRTSGRSSRYVPPKVSRSQLEELMN